MGGHRTHQTMFPKHSCLKPWSPLDMNFYTLYEILTVFKDTAIGLEPIQPIRETRVKTWRTNHYAMRQYDNDYLNR